MAIVFEAGDAFCDNTSATSHTFANFVIDAGSDRLLVVAYSDNGGSESVSDITFNSNSLAVGREGDFNAAFAQTQIWYEIAPTETTADIVVTLGSSNRAVTTGISLTGVHQTTPIGDTDGANGTTTTSTSLTLDTQPGDLVISCLAVRNSGGDPGALVPTDGTEIEELLDTTGGNFRGSALYKEAVGSSTSVGWSWTTSTAWSHSAVVIKPSGTAKIKAIFKYFPKKKIRDAWVLANP